MDTLAVEGKGPKTGVYAYCTEPWFYRCCTLKEACAIEDAANRDRCAQPGLCYSQAGHPFIVAIMRKWPSRVLERRWHWKSLGHD